MLGLLAGLLLAGLLLAALPSVQAQDNAPVLADVACWGPAIDASGFQPTD